MGLLSIYKDMPDQWKLDPSAHREDIFRSLDEFIPSAAWYSETPADDAVQSLRAVAELRAERREDLEALRRDSASIWEDFGFEPSPELVEDWERRQQERRARITGEIKTLRLVFMYACRIYSCSGVRLSGGRISRLKQLYLSAGMKKALDEMKRPPRTAFDARGRLSRKDVSAIYHGLASAGLISGPLETFSKHFDLEPIREDEAFLPPLEPLQWTGGPSLLGYFIWRYWKRLPEGYSLRNYAAPVLNAFAVPEPQRRSVRRLLSMLNEGKQKTVRGGAVIDRLFDGLQGTGSTSAE